MWGCSKTYCLSLMVNWKRLSLSRKEQNPVLARPPPTMHMRPTPPHPHPTLCSRLPWESQDLIRKIKANTPGMDNVILSAHCHNDLGQAASNTLMGACATGRCTGMGLPRAARAARDEQLEKRWLWALVAA